MASKRVSEKKVVVSSGASPAPRNPASRRTARSAKAAESAAVAPAEIESPMPVTAEPVAAELVTKQPSPEAIAALAYSYWLARNCQGGSPEEDWFRAEQELRARNVAAAVA